jgi:V8-like Glu-specific endopeptidase
MFMTGKLIGTRLPAKITGMLIALVMATCFMAYYGNVFKVSAVTTIMTGDVNGNGVVDANDVTLLASFLYGSANINPDRGDVDQNGVVDQDDVSLLSKYIVGVYSVVQSWDSSYTVNSTTSNNAGTTSYIKRTLGSNPSSSSYSLTVNSPQTPNGIMTLSTSSFVDNRVPYSNSSIVRLSFVVNGLSYTGTGFIIGSNKVVTAAHCACYNSTFASSITVIAKRPNGTTSSYTVSEAHIPQSATSLIAADYDYAVLKVNTNGVDLAATYGVSPMGVVINDHINDNGTVNAAGYGRTQYNGPVSLITGSGTLNHLQSTNSILYIDAIVTGGQSGGPVFVDGDNDITTTDDVTVIGINADSWDELPTPGYDPYGNSGNTWGPRITAKQLKFFHNNSNF